MRKIYFPLLIVFIFLSSSVSALDYYWVGGSGNWSDINHWATASGGSTKHIVVPSPDDNVIFDLNSFSTTGQIVQIDPSIASCRDFILGNFTQSPSFVGTGELRVFGSMRLTPTANWGYMGKVKFEAITPGHTVTTEGVNFNNDVIFNGMGGGWTLQDTLRNTSSIYLNHGHLNLNSKYVKTRYFFSTASNQRVLTFGTALMELYNSFQINSANLTLSAAQSTIVFEGGGTFSAMGTTNLVFNDLYFLGGMNATINVNFAEFNTIRIYTHGNMSGNFDIDSLYFREGNDYKTVGTATINALFEAVATCVTMIDWEGPMTVNMPSSAAFNVVYCNIQDITAIGTNAFLANQCYDLGGNSGLNIIVPSPQNLYWVGGQGDWHDTAHWSFTSGGPGGACLPTAVDNVFFDQNSFFDGDTVDIVLGTAFCHDMTWMNLQYSPFVNHLAPIEIWGSLTLHDSVRWGEWVSAVTFMSNDMGETITSSSVELYANIFFYGQGGWTFQDSLLLMEGKIDHGSGSVATGNNTIITPLYLSQDTTTRTLTLGSSDFYVTGEDPHAWFLNGLNFTLNSGTSDIYITGLASGMVNSSSFGFIFHNVHFTDTIGRSALSTDYNIFNRVFYASDGFVLGDNQFDTLSLSKGHDYEIVWGSLQTIIDELDVYGDCDGSILIHTDETDSSATISKATGVVNNTYLVLRDIHASGGATFNANSSVDLGNNTGWNFVSLVGTDLYWVNGTGLWSDTAHWSYTSGGPGGACVPSPLDDVYFDTNSFITNSDSVIVDLANATAHSMIWTPNLPNPTFTGVPSNSVRLWGSLTFDSTMYNNFLGKFYFESRNLGDTITVCDNIFFNEVWLYGKGGGWRVTDSISVPGNNLNHKFGHLDAQGKVITAFNYDGSWKKTRSLLINGATINLLGTAYDSWLLVHDSLTFNADTSEFYFKSFGGGMENESSMPINAHYHNVTFTNPTGKGVMQSSGVNCYFNIGTFYASMNFLNSNRFDSVYFHKGGDYLFRDTTTMYFNHLEANGNCFDPIVIGLSGNGTDFHFNQPTDTVKISGVLLDHCEGIGGAVFIAEQSTDNGFNTNWTITNSGSYDLYWVNGTGNWGDSSHWSYTSGGPGGACIPTPTDNVFFDNNSFLTPLDTVNVDLGVAECHDMQWLTLATNPLFLAHNSAIDIHGSLRMDSAMISDIMANVNFKSTHTGNYIIQAGEFFKGNTIFEGVGGGWEFLDSLRMGGSWIHANGDILTNGNLVVASRYLSGNSNPRSLDLDSSEIRLNSQWNLNATNFTLDAGTSTITFTNPASFRTQYGSTQVRYHNVLIFPQGGLSNIIQKSVPVFYNKMYVGNSANINGVHEFDTLIFMPGNQYTFEKLKTQVVNKNWTVRGNNCYPINLRSTQQGIQATVTMASDTVSGDFLHIRDMEVVGGAVFYAGNNSTDISNNSGWIFNNSPSYIYGLGPDINFQIGSTVTLSTANFNGGPGTTYLWNTGSTNPNLTVTQPGYYSVIVTYAGGCVVYDTIKVGCSVDPTFNLGHCVCFGDSLGFIDMTIPDTVATYTINWSTGDTIEDISNLKAGMYIVNLLGSTGCDGEDTVFIQEPPPLVVKLNDTSYCETDPGMTLDAGGGFINYWWDGIAGSQMQWVTGYDTLTLLVQDPDGCYSTGDTVIVTVDSVPEIDLGESVEICLGETLELTPGPGFTTYLWQDGSTDSIFTAVTGGIYWVEVLDITCINTDTVELVDCDPMLSFPNVFTPNSDGYNDYFYPVHQNIINFRMIIYNRWGDVVFETNDVYDKWDGRSLNGNLCTDGVYYYTVEYEQYGLKGTKGKKLHHGSVTILRGK